MRSTAIFVAAGLAGFGAVEPEARACNQAIEVVDARPQSRSIPQRAWAVFETPFAGEVGWQAVLRSPGGQTSPLSVFPITPHHISVQLDDLPLQTNVEVEVRAPGGETAYALTVASDGRPDTTPPSAPTGVRLSSTYVSGDMCLGDGWWISVSFVPATDDRAVLGYFLLDRDTFGPEAVGGLLAPVDFEPEGLGFRVFVRAEGRRCYDLVSVDEGVNVSAPGEAVCIDLVVPPPPPPPVDAGAPLDSGSPRDASGPADARPRPDAGASGDSGGLAGLAEAEASCGCTSADRPARAGGAGFALLVLGLLGLRRSPNRTSGCCCGVRRP